MTYKGKRHWRLWLKFYWYKYIRRMDIVGFFAGVPIIRTKYLQPDQLEDKYEAGSDPSKSFTDSEFSSGLLRGDLH